MTKQQKSLLIKISKCLPQTSLDRIHDNRNILTVQFSQTTFTLGQSLLILKDCKGSQIYDFLICEKVKMPIGMCKWNQIYHLTDQQIKNAFEFPSKCTQSVKSIFFQYKISTFTLPTREYLWNYQVNDDHYCIRCLSDSNNPSYERDTIIHCLSTCPKLGPFLSHVLKFLVNDCKASSHISEINYFLGFQGNQYEGLNCALIELKKYIFYNFDKDKSIKINFRLYKSRLRRVILCDKRYHFSCDKIDHFYKKWSKFSSVYQIYGPDPMY